jgi:hypothetical protein
MSRSFAIIKFLSEYIPNLFSPSIEEEFVAAAAATRSSWMVLSLVEFFSNFGIVQHSLGFCNIVKGKFSSPNQGQITNFPFDIGSQYPSRHLA